MIRVPTEAGQPGKLSEKKSGNNCTKLVLILAPQVSSGTGKSAHA